MDACTGKASPNPEQLSRLVLVTCERLVSKMVEKVSDTGYAPSRGPSSVLGAGGSQWHEAISHTLLSKWLLLVASHVSDTAGCIVGLDGIIDDLWLMIYLEIPEMNMEAWDTR